MDMVTDFLETGVLPTVLLLVRAIVPVLALYVVWRSYTSFKKGQRRRDPVVMLCDESSGLRFPVLYWENSIGRSKSCDICLPDATISRDHAVLMRREEGWVICDTGSHAGVQVNGKKVRGQKLLSIDGAAGLLYGGRGCSYAGCSHPNSHGHRLGAVCVFHWHSAPGQL